MWQLSLNWWVRVYDGRPIDQMQDEPLLGTCPVLRRREFTAYMLLTDQYGRERGDQIISGQ